MSIEDQMRDQLGFKPAEEDNNDNNNNNNTGDPNTPPVVDDNLNTDNQNVGDPNTDKTIDNNTGDDKDQNNPDLSGAGKDKVVDNQDDTKHIPDDNSDGAANEPDFDKLLAEKSNGRFNTVADIDKALEDKPDNSFANDQIAKLNEYVRQGGKFNDFMRTQTADYSKMSDLDVLRESTKMSNPDLTSDDVDLLLEDAYGVAKDASDREKRLSTLKMKTRANEDRKALKEYQGKWAVPEITTEQQNAKLAEEREVWENNFKTASDSVKEIQFKVNETESVAYKIEGEDIKTIEKYKDISQVLKRYVDKDGKEDVAKFVREMYILENLDKVMRTVAAQSKSSGGEKIVEDMKNTNFKGGKSGVVSDPNLSIEGQAAQHFFGGQ